MSRSYAIDDARERQLADERQDALRSLLAKPLLGSGDAALPLVRRHADWLREWFLRETGWLLMVERELARLYKRPADLCDASRGIPGFDRRRYVLLCLACAVLERAGPQISLALLGQRLLSQAAHPALQEAGFAFLLETATERRELVHVCRWLLGTGALTRVEGGEESWVGGQGDALYDIQRRVLALLPAAGRGPSTFAPEDAPADLAARLEALSQEFTADSDDGRRTRQRHHLARRLLDDPVLYFDELEGPARDYISGQRGLLAARLTEATGLVAEQRREGMALVDADGLLSDRRLPAEGTTGHVTLLLAGFLGERLKEQPDVAVGMAEVGAFLRRAADDYGRYWRKQAREPGAETALAQEALEVLEALKLVQVEAGQVWPRPALARFAPGAPEVRQAALL